jgi:drug/metabolite transporter (DMT)-like permease
MPVLTATFLVGALLDLPVALIASPAIPPLARVTPTAWIALAVLTLFITPVNLACQNLAMRRLDASQVANFSNISPVLSVAWGAWLFGEPITASLVVGGTITLAGVYWTGRRRSQPAPAVEALRTRSDHRPIDWPLKSAKGQPAPGASTAAG